MLKSSDLPGKRVVDDVDSDDDGDDEIKGETAESDPSAAATDKTHSTLHVYPLRFLKKENDIQHRDIHNWSSSTITGTNRADLYDGPCLIYGHLLCLRRCFLEMLETGFHQHWSNCYSMQ